MDERQTQVVSGAGLQESRINTEFVDFLSKWGPRALYVLLAIVLGFLGYQQWTKHKMRLADQAFSDYEAQVASRNPDLLLKVATDHAAQPAVWALATRDAAAVLLNSAIMGINPGADLIAPRPEDIMSPAQRTAMFQKAESLYRDVLAKSRNDASRFTFAQQARWGIASALVSQGKTDEAKKMLEEFIAQGGANNHPDLVALGTERLNRINAMTTAPVVVAQAALPDSALRGGRPAPAPAPAPQIEVKPANEATAQPGETLPIRKIDAPAPQGDTPLPPPQDPPADPAPANPGIE